ncbi:MAG TPA: MarR family winged helix-turn-helix transcriptional regulator, partial [Candidatus Dormibacteraeota bacterium]
VGLLRRIERGPGRSQQALASDLGVVPSRIVPLLDDLAGAGLIERRPSETDRRTYAVHLTERGGRIMIEVHRLAAAHSEAMSAGLSPSQRQQLTKLLGIVAHNQGLSVGVHPGYRYLPSPRGEPAPPSGAAQQD